MSSCAVVIGASVAGLSAAQILSEFFDQVFIFERDIISGPPGERRGTPQVIHAHGLLPRGLQAMEEIFPGFSSEMEQKGAKLGEMQQLSVVTKGKIKLAAKPSQVIGLAASRIAIESHLRFRVHSNRKIKAFYGYTVVGIRHQKGQVEGVVCMQADSKEKKVYACDLVVDAGGRHSKTPSWYKELGFAEPIVEIVDSKLTYWTAYYERNDVHTDGKALFLHLSSKESPVYGVAISQEPNGSHRKRWVVSVGQSNEVEKLAPTPENMKARILATGCDGFAKIVLNNPIISSVSKYNFPASIRRRYDLLKTYPSGIVTIGDANVSFSPAYGQGMTSAVVQALELRQALKKDHTSMSYRYYRNVKKLTDVPWALATEGDQTLLKDESQHSFSLRVSNAYLDLLLKTAETDAEVSLAFQKVIYMMGDKKSLLAPWILARIAKKLFWV